MKKENQFTCLSLSLFVRTEFSIHDHYILNALSMTDTQEKKQQFILMICLNFFDFQKF